MSKARGVGFCFRYAEFSGPSDFAEILPAWAGLWAAICMTEVELSPSWKPKNYFPRIHLKFSWTSSFRTVSNSNMHTYCWGSCPNADNISASLEGTWDRHLKLESTSELLWFYFVLSVSQEQDSAYKTHPTKVIYPQSNFASNPSCRLGLRYSKCSTRRVPRFSWHVPIPKSIGG